MSTQISPTFPVAISRRCCQVRYRVRWFNSKGAGLVLFWNLCVSAAATTMYELNINLSIAHTGNYYIRVLTYLFFTLLAIVCAPLSGWLADAKFGNYRVFKFGFVVLFIVNIIICLVTLISVRDENMYIVRLVFTVFYGLGISGFVVCFVTSVQLGLDQMPDGSAENITSFISLFSVSIVSGFWISDTLYSVLSECAFQTETNIQVCCIFPVICMCIILLLNFAFGRKWLTIEPQSPQSLKNILRVLKFAAKHKAPINRSALTYWEENVPSRMDLGKSRYGGPFSTEQVEDVKTIFKLLLVFLPLWMIVPALVLPVTRERLTPSIYPPGYSKCSSTLLFVFTYSPIWCTLLGGLIFEFVIYPVVKHKLPSILKRIGIVAFFIMLLNTASLIYSAVNYANNTELEGSTWFYDIFQVLFGFSALSIFLCVYEFVCAQSPYSMRALLVGYTTLVLLFSFGIAAATIYLLHNICHHTKKHVCPVSRDAISLLMSIVGFLLHCVLAHWYKKRVREDISTPHRWVEEVYDRYLSQEQRSTEET